MRKRLVMSLLVAGTVLSLSGCGSFSEPINTEVKADEEIEEEGYYEKTVTCGYCGSEFHSLEEEEADTCPRDKDITDWSLVGYRELTDGEPCYFKPYLMGYTDTPNNNTAMSVKTKVCGYCYRPIDTEYRLSQDTCPRDKDLYVTNVLYSL